MLFEFNAANNSCNIGERVELRGFIKGTNNTVVIESPVHECRIDLRISGDNNNVHIFAPFAVKGLNIRIGNHVPAHRVKLDIAEGFSIEGGGNFFLYNSGNILEIGANCMFSNTVTIRCGDSPHLLFDKNTGEYLDVSEGIFIGQHVWVGERVYITKRASIASESVAAACAVVTKRFEEEHVVLAGNPAKVVRRNAQWIRNHSHLIPAGIFAENYRAHKEQFMIEKGKNNDQ